MVCLSVCVSERVKWVFLVILQLLYLPPPKGEEKAAEGGLFASMKNFHTKINERQFLVPARLLIIS